MSWFGHKTEVCGVCHKRDFTDNMRLLPMVFGAWGASGFTEWRHIECDREARRVRLCPRCKGSGEVYVKVARGDTP
ncbi:MAG TPA: hypothetical protein VM487_14215 [Phycisphaerae bacterium]|nr:hypothetical protein [Phycisphaerae bacterium]